MRDEARSLPPAVQDAVSLTLFAFFASLVWDVLVRECGCDAQISWTACGFAVVLLSAAGKITDLLALRASLAQ